MITFNIKDETTTKEFTFYGSGRENGAIIKSIDGLEYPDVRSAIDVVAGKKSAVYVNSKFGLRIITLTAQLFGDAVKSLFTRRSELLQAIRQEGYMKLVKFTTFDSLNLQFEAEVTKLVNPYTKNLKPLMLELVAPDWRFYSQTESTDTILATATEIVTNSGNEKTDPILQITGPANSITITNLTTGGTFTLSENLTAGQVLVINTKEQTVVLNPSTNKFSILTGDFFALGPGANSVEFAATGSDANTKLEVIYRSAYLGL